MTYKLLFYVIIFTSFWGTYNSNIILLTTKAEYDFLSLINSVFFTQLAYKLRLLFVFPQKNKVSIFMTFLLRQPNTFWPHYINHLFITYITTDSQELL